MWQVWQQRCCGSAVAVLALLGIAGTSQAQKPTFLPDGDMENFSIREDTPPGTVIYTLRGLDPSGRLVSYSASGDELSVDAVTGAVTLVTALDRETVAVINTIITVAAESPRGGAPDIVPLRRQIPVEDVNDNDPKFVGGPYTFTVGESAPPGATLYSDVKVTDADEGDNAKVSLTCNEQQDPEACRVFGVRGASSGSGAVMAVITLREPLNYETRQEYRIPLLARDGGAEGRRVSNSSVAVVVRDEQDEPPLFLNSPYSATVREADPSSRQLLQGTRVLRVRVRDGDVAHPRPLSLTLEGDDRGYFALQDVEVDDEGVTNANIVTSETLLDREDADVVNNGGIYSFRIKAEEQGDGSPAATTAPVTIVVTDADDQRPVFSSPAVGVTVGEDLVDGTPLSGLDLLVSDGDLGVHATFELGLESVYPPESEGVFSVFPHTVVGRSPVILKVADSTRIDFEDEGASHFVLKVVARQGGVAVSSAIVNVTVTDANDNPPVFESPAYRASVSEGAQPYTPITALTATDADAGEYATLSYSLKGFGSEKFTVNSSSGEISLALCGTGLDSCLDYERQSSYSLTFLATDGGGRVTAVNLFLDVLDENDNSPVFEQLVYRRTVDEGATEFVPPLVVEATDADGEQQESGGVSYSLYAGNTPDAAFELHPSTGELRVRRPLTYLDTPTSSYTLTVRATDAGTPPRHSDVRVMIRVGRQTNKAPRFLKKIYTAHVPETAEPGTVVANLEAMDPDRDPSMGDIARYQMGAGAGDTFVVDGTTGEVRLADMAKLDRDEAPRYEIQVLAVDHDADAPQTATVTLTVNVTDVNNKPPKFSQRSYTVHTSERLPIGEVVLHLSASDPDEDARLRYFLKSPTVARDRTGVALTPASTYDYRGVFTVNATTGAVTVAGPLDHNAAAVLILTVGVTDEASVQGLQSDTVDVTVYIQAFSDANPIFGAPWTPSHPQLEVLLKEEEPLDKPVFAVTAKDPVSGQPVRRYEKVLGSDPRGLFTVAPITGQVSLSRRLDYEHDEDKVSTLRVVAVSGDRSSEAAVTVRLQDINDNSPQFTEEEYHARVSEASRWPTAVVTVSASDADTGAYGTVRYSLGGEAAQLFVVDVTTGQIAVARGAQLDREQQAVLALEVTATDTPGGGLTSRWTAVKVVIELTDVNDEAPEWSAPGYTAVVAENAPVGTPVTHVLARDPDTGLNGLVRYALPHQQPPLGGLFALDPENGVLTVAAPLRGKGRGAPYEITLRALDQGAPQQHFSESILRLYIGDVSANDGVPVFVRPQANEVAEVLENSKPGTAVFQVKATDPDDPDSNSGKLLYSFLDNTANNGIFVIDPDTGVISTKALLDRERRSHYSVVVVAQDRGTPPQQASRVLDIRVTDADDNDPVFLQRSPRHTQFTIEEEAAPGTVVGEVTATDRDEGDNALIDYAITYGNDDGLLSLDRTGNNTALLTVRHRVDREQVGSIVLTIACGKLGTRLPSRQQYKDGDPHLLQVTVSVQDLDDNIPKFESSMVHAGVRVDAPLQTPVVTLTAVDPDPTSPPIRYSLYNVSFEHSVGGAGYLLPEGEVDARGVFLLEETSGTLLTNAPLTRYTHGFFSILVEAESEPGHEPVYAQVKVVVVRDSDLMKFIFNAPPGEVRPKLTSFKENVEESLPVPANLIIYDTIYYTDGHGAIDFSKTGSCFQLEERSRHDIAVLLDAADNSRLKQVYDKYGVAGVERCVTQRVSRATTADWVEVWVLVLAGLIGVSAAVAACSVCCLYARYKKSLRRHQPHFRLIDSPVHGPPLAPGSLIMLPPGPALQPGGGGMSVPPSEAGGRSYEWQERHARMDTVSFSSVAR